MTEINWLKLSGLMHQCNYNSENTHCPFIKFRTQDYFQQYQTLSALSDLDGQQMLRECGASRDQCKTIKARTIKLNETRKEV